MDSKFGNTPTVLTRLVFTSVVADVPGVAEITVSVVGFDATITAVGKPLTGPICLLQKRHSWYM